MSNIPDLSGVATSDLIQQIESDRFKASYINWARTMHLLRTHAPGWIPELVPDETTGSILHRAPVGGFLLIRFRHTDGSTTPPAPQAVMNNSNASVAYDKITARDITDTHRRGFCMAAALTFGLAYELWAKMPLEDAYAENEEEEQNRYPTYDEAAELYAEDFRILTEHLDDNDYDKAYEVYNKIPVGYRNAVWVAPTKLPPDVVPVYTTLHRKKMKSDEWSQARTRYIENLKETVRT